MADTEFQDQAKGFADALLSHRMSSILGNASSDRQQFQLAEGDAEVIDDALDMLSSCEAGLIATEQPTASGEMGFLEWMNNLKHYESAFDAIVRAQLADKEKDVAKALAGTKELLTKLRNGEFGGNLDRAIRFFDSMSEISLETGADTTATAPQEMQHPEELELTSL